MSLGEGGFELRREYERRFTLTAIWREWLPRYAGSGRGLNRIFGTVRQGAKVFTRKKAGNNEDGTERFTGARRREMPARVLGPGPGSSPSERSASLQLQGPIGGLSHVGKCAPSDPREPVKETAGSVGRFAVDRIQELSRTAPEGRPRWDASGGI